MHLQYYKSAIADYVVIDCFGEGLLVLFFGMYDVLASSTISREGAFFGNSWR